MGTDIHYLIEAGPVTDRRAIVAETEIHRSYHLFTVLAGCRAYLTAERGFPNVPFVEPRGEVVNPTSALRHFYDSWQDGMHSASWLTTDEVEAAAEVYAGTYREGRSGCLDSLVREMRKLDFPDSPAVFAFFFDN